MLLREFDFERLSEVTALVAANLDRVIDESYYPVETARRSNMRHRPIGIGVQGLADCFILLGLPFDSPAAAQLNRDIFETIYYAALKVWPAPHSPCSAPPSFGSSLPRAAPPSGQQIHVS